MPTMTWPTQRGVPSLAEERPRLVRLCALLTADPDAAEDLAQETLWEAHRGRQRVRDPARYRAWLTGIARNVCRRWARRRGHELERFVHPAAYDGEVETPVDPPAPFDVGVELERNELAQLLDRALALLPVPTRAVLVEHYLRERPQAEIALRLGVSQAAVVMRLQRGKVGLRRVLTTELRDEAAAHGLVDASGPAWQETRIWCWMCGQRRLLGRFSEGHREIWLCCPGCVTGQPEHLSYSNVPPRLRGIKSFRRTVVGMGQEATSYYRDGFAAGGVAPCHGCGRTLPLRPGLPDYVPAHLRHWAGVHALCGDCGSRADFPLWGFVLASPEGRRFWRDHPRLVVLPERGVDAGGPAIVTALQSLTSAARLTVVSSRDRFRTLAVDGAPPA
jgi:RNA polymerase sigma-70 factor (ECF subfamily)